MAESGLERSLKDEFMGLPPEFFEVLAFGELKVGDKYIGLPLPGDNEGHGGYKGVHYIFKKIKPAPPKHDYDLPNNSMRLRDKVLINSPDGMYVLKVK